MAELRQLRAFVAVAEELNFTRAAGRLHLAQQAVSKSVRQLERELGVELLERTSRDVRLTPAGEVLLDEGRRALAAAAAAFARAQAAGLGLIGTVRVGVTPAIGPRDRGDVATALRDGHPDLSVSFHDVRPREVHRRLRSRELDLVLARTSGPAPGIESEALRPSRLVLCVPNTHPLAGESPVRLAQLDGERLLTWNPPGTPYTDLLVSRLAAAGAHVEPIEARVTGSQALTELVETNAVALVPEGWPPSDSITQARLADDISLPLLVVWPTGRTPPAVTRLRAHLTS